RSMATCMAMGQAAGTAAALAVSGGLTPRALDAGVLRARLLDDSALLDPVEPSQPMEVPA
nr:FAD-dependent oxidoreductase [Chloroflexota bacterium]